MKNATPEWWCKPRFVSLVVDNPSWIMPYVEELVGQVKAAGDEVRLCKSHDEVLTGGVAFYLGCVRITPPAVLARNHKNLIIHESALPKGRGFSPLTWQILAGNSMVPVTMLEAVDEVDAGDIIYQEEILFEGHELIGEMRQALGQITVDLCLRYLAEKDPSVGRKQVGEATFFKRRRPSDSQLDIRKTLAEQFDLLRVVDNERYPAYFNYQGKCYRLQIEKVDEPMQTGNKK
ncbi:formyltransferase family protein [Thermodesulfobacteriota bacterium]